MVFKIRKYTPPFDLVSDSTFSTLNDRTSNLESLPAFMLVSRKKKFIK